MQKAPLLTLLTSAFLREYVIGGAGGALIERRAGFAGWEALDALFGLGVEEGAFLAGFAPSVFEILGWGTVKCLDALVF